MAASNQENETRQLRLDDLLNTLRAKHGEQSDDEEDKETDTSENLSMFCKNCLHPYSGQEKDGSLILRCQKCGHRDVVPEGEAANLNPADWKGNLMMNRFVQVLKEQEELSINIIDPDFAEDDYKRLTLALNEYCAYMNCIAVKLYDMAKEARGGEEQMEDSRPGNVSSPSDSRNDNREEDGRADNPADVINDISEEYLVFPQSAKEELKQVAATLIKIMKGVIVKYGLSSEIWVNVEKRMREKSLDDAADDDTEDQNGAETSTETDEKEEASVDKDEADEAESASLTEPETVNEALGETEEKDETQSAECSAGENYSEILERDVLGLLKSKFKLEDYTPEEDDSKSYSTRDFNATLGDAEGFSLEENREVEEQASSVDTDAEKGIETESEKSEEIEINFCTASMIFLSELQKCKREALLSRKEKALAIVNQKIKTLKSEMERVENEVRDELHTAYETKVKKVENQRRQLTARHKHVKDIEFLLGHYMETGQMDKLTELLEELDIQYDN